MVLVLLYNFTPIPSLTDVIYVFFQLLLRCLIDKEFSCNAGDAGNLGFILESGYT